MSFYPRSTSGLKRSCMTEENGVFIRPIMI